MAKGNKTQVSCQQWKITHDGITDMMENYKANTGIEITRIAAMEKMRQVTLSYCKQFQKPKGKK